MKFSIVNLKTIENKTEKFLYIEPKCAHKTVKDNSIFIDLQGCHTLRLNQASIVFSISHLVLGQLKILRVFYKNLGSYVFIFGKKLAPFKD